MSNRDKRQRRNRRGDPSIHADDQGRPIRTPSGYCYKFVKKHHYPCEPGQACWLREVPRAVEFDMFFRADSLRLADERGNFYNVWRDGDSYRVIGTRDEKVAKFWKPNSNKESHGFPVYLISPLKDHRRKGQRDYPPRAALQRMVDKAVICQRDMMMILRGKDI